LGSLRTIHSKRYDSIRLLDRQITSKDKVVMEPSVGADREGTYRWIQGDLRFVIDIFYQISLDNELFTFLKVGVHDGLRYIRYSKDLRMTRDEAYAYESEPGRWDLESQGIFALCRNYPDFPLGWQIDIKTE
jgi:hypothetical protein